MEVASQSLTSLSCEITIIQAKNTEFLKCKGTLFVRYYLTSSRAKNRIQLNTKELPLHYQQSYGANLAWNESFSLECLGTEDSINTLKQESVVFELRWRSKSPVLRKLCGGSQLVGRAAVPWSRVVESPRMEMESWVLMGVEKSYVLDGLKPPSVQIRMRVQGLSMVDHMKLKKKGNDRKKRRDHECCCCIDSVCKCEDYDIFALGAFEAL